MKKLRGLYVITNETLMPEKKFLSMAGAAICSGISVIQYRDKSTDKTKRISQASALKNLCDEHNVIFIINDDINLAKQVDADGVHIGKNDVSLKQARQQLGANKIIGVSCYNQLTLAESAVNEGADYIAFGSFFGSNIKPDAAVAKADIITSFKQKFDTPVCCIGGITSENHLPLSHAGADMLAVISDIFSHSSSADITSSCKRFFMTTLEPQ